MSGGGHTCHRQYAKMINADLQTSRQWEPEEDAVLGTATDIEVARRLGRTKATVCHRRRALKIPGFHPRIWTADVDKLLGTVPDPEIARRMGCTEANVRPRRVQLGIAGTRQIRLWTPEEDSWSEPCRIKSWGRNWAGRSWPWRIVGNAPARDQRIGGASSPSTPARSSPAEMVKTLMR